MRYPSAEAISVRLVWRVLCDDVGDHVTDVVKSSINITNSVVTRSIATSVEFFITLAERSYQVLSLLSPYVIDLDAHLSSNHVDLRIRRCLALVKPCSSVCWLVVSKWALFSGQMLVSERLRGDSFQRKTPHVTQQELHLHTSAVCEASNFSVLFRQPATYS